jgi:hypothetical protein
MKMHRWFGRSVPAALAAVAIAAPAAFAQQGQPIFSWTGRVDREVQLVVRNNQLSTRDIGPTEPRGSREQMFGRMPRADGQLVVQVANGRGRVDVVEQPSAQNNYTAVVRIQDPQSGSDTYRLTGYWQGYSNGDVYNGRARGRDDRGDRGDRGGNDNRDIYRDRGNGNNGNGNGVYDRNNGNGYNQQAMHWSGNVDGELEIRIQNGRVSYRNLSGQQPTSMRADIANLNMPRNGAILSVVQNQGRGSVNIVQQPSQYNGYSAVVRVRDPQGGYGFYDFSLAWQ